MRAAAPVTRRGANRKKTSGTLYEAPDVQDPLPDLLPPDRLRGRARRRPQFLRLRLPPELAARDAPVRGRAAVRDGRARILTRAARVAPGRVAGARPTLLPRRVACPDAARVRRSRLAVTIRNDVR